MKEQGLRARIGSMTDLHRFPLLTAEEIANSPSRRDGIKAETEEVYLNRAAKVIYQTSRAAPFPNM